MYGISELHKLNQMEGVEKEQEDAFIALERALKERRTKNEATQPTKTEEKQNVA